MPPEGYETVTLRVSLCERLDDMTDRPGLNSRQDVIAFLLEDRQAAERGDAVTADGFSSLQSSIETVEARTGRIERAIEQLSEGRR